MLSESSTTAINRDHFDQQFAQLAPVAISVLFETKDNECDPEKFSHVLEYFIQEEIITEKEKAQLVKRFSLLQQQPEAYTRWIEPFIIRAAQREVIQPEILNILNIVTNSELFKVQVFQTLLHMYENKNLAIIAHEKSKIFHPLYLVICSLGALSAGAILYSLANKSSRAMTPTPLLNLNQSNMTPLIPSPNKTQDLFLIAGISCFVGGALFGCCVILNFVYKAINDYLKTCLDKIVPASVTSIESSFTLPKSTDTGIELVSVPTLKEVASLKLQKAQLLLTFLKNTFFLKRIVRTGHLSFSCIITPPEQTYPAQHLHQSPTAPNPICNDVDIDMRRTQTL